MQRLFDKDDLVVLSKPCHQMLRALKNKIPAQVTKNIDFFHA